MQTTRNRAFWLRHCTQAYLDCCSQTRLPTGLAERCVGLENLSKRRHRLASGRPSAFLSRGASVYERGHVYCRSAADAGAHGGSAPTFRPAIAAAACGRRSLVPPIFMVAMSPANTSSASMTPTIEPPPSGICRAAAHNFGQNCAAPEQRCYLRPPASASACTCTDGGLRAAASSVSLMLAVR